MAGMPRVGRLLLAGGVAFWWGGVVAPRFLSLLSPARLPPEAIRVI